MTDSVGRLHVYVALYVLLSWDGIKIPITLKSSDIIDLSEHDAKIAMTGVF